MITLRPAALDDETRLLAWRNDPATRASAFNEAEVSPEAHKTWLARKLADPACAIVVAEEEGEPVAQVRFERIEPDLAEIDIAVAPQARGRGVGRRVLRLAVGDARRVLGVTRVRARVKPTNEASLKAFRAAGFAVTRAGGAAIELERFTES
jgi:RimJ/RimL family protein N-acetyltransferase